MDGDIESLQSNRGKLQKEIRNLETEKNRIEGSLNEVRKDISAEKRTLSELNEYKRLELNAIFLLEILLLLRC